MRDTLLNIYFFFTSMVKKRFEKLRSLGPGLITGASDDDPSGITVYTQAGASLGLTQLWTAFLTIPFMAAIQEMCARIGIVAGKGLTATIKEHYPKWVLYVLLFLSVPAIVFNIGADISAVGAVLHLLIPIVPIWFFSSAFVLVLIIFLIHFSYTKIASVLKFLCLSLLLYFIVPFLVHQDWANVLKQAVTPTISFSKVFFASLVAILGTTISPYLFFWQTSMSLEDHLHKYGGEKEKKENEKNEKMKKVIMVHKKEITSMRWDVDIGMIFSNVVMFFIILTAGTVLYSAGIQNIQTVEEAALALIPLAGNASYFLFAIGIIGTGALAIPILAGSLSYSIAELFNWKEGLDKKFHEASHFYLVLVFSLIIGLLLPYFHVDPITALIYTAVIYGITAPVLIGIILHICNNKKIMGKYTNGRGMNILGGTVLVVMTASVVGLFFVM